uniref:ATP synthase subunit a n=1 Tax=Ibidoecus plataleae TaxID=3004258 RepID=A0A9E9J3I1_9NEOP|nr:ATP synthase F0 subunit 6 [Ibidoecus plataleae]
MTYSFYYPLNCWKNVIISLKLILTSMFSSFDPSIYVAGGLYVPLKWLVVTFVLALPFWDKNLIPGSPWFAGLFAKSFGTKGSSKFMTSGIFLFILFCNILSLVPYSFSSTSHLVFNLFIAMPIWVSSLLLLVKSSKMKALGHFVPSGAPLVLAPFLFFIELISFFIRPISLSVRLMANMMAGHFLIILLTDMVSKSFVLIFMVNLSSFLLFYELGVSVVQAYVFSMLSSLYLEESKASH